MIRQFVALLATIVLVTTTAATLRGQNDPASRRAAINVMYPVMIQALEAKNFGHARHICDQAILWEPQNPTHHYNLACIEAQAGPKRFGFAMGALELAVALGFDDVDHLQVDPDLMPLRHDPKFLELVRKVANNANAGAALSGIVVPSAPARVPGTARPPAAPSSPPAERTAIVQPAPNSIQEGRPVGLFFMTRFRSSPGSLEKAAWYFAPDGTVYQNLESGFAAADLSAHTGRKGTCRRIGEKLEVTWVGGKQTASTFALSTSGAGFSWDAGIFSAVKPFADAREAEGVYEGGESLVAGGSSAALTKRLELKADGAFTWSGVSFASTSTHAGRVSVGGTGATTGRWELQGWSLILTDTSGAVLRRIAFPYDDEKTPVNPDRMFFGGWLYRKK